MGSNLGAKAESTRSTGPERDVPITLAGWIRLVLRAIALALALLICVPLHYAYRTVHYGSPFPKLFLRIACRTCPGRTILLRLELIWREVCRELLSRTVLMELDEI